MAWRAATLIKDGIRLNNTNPGPTQTPMMPAFEASAGKELIDAFVGPSGRRSSPEEQAWPMLFLALAIIPIIVVPMTVDLSPQSAALLQMADWLIWAAFAIEYIVRFAIAPSKWPFARHNVLDLIVVVVPFAQPLRLLRSVRVLRVLRAVCSTLLLLAPSPPAVALLVPDRGTN